MFRKTLQIALRFTLITTLLLGIGYPLLVTGFAQLALKQTGQRRTHYPRTASSSAPTDRAELLLGEILPQPPLRCRQRLRRQQLQRFKLRAIQPEAGHADSRRRRQGKHRQSHPAGADRPGHRIRFRTRSRHHPRGRALPGPPRRAGAQAQRRRSDQASECAHHATPVRPSRRAARQCARTQSGAGRPE